MDGGSIAQWLATVIIGVGLIATWWHNGKNRAKDLGSLETEVKNIQSTLNDPNYGLGALKEDVSSFKTHCAKVSTSLAERVGSAEKGIEDLKGQPRRKGKG